MARSAREVAYEHLQRGIADGDYPPGAWLREDDVAIAAGVSRTPVREALHRLHSEGAVTLQHNRGAIVVGWTATDLDDIYDLRILLECYGIRQVAERHADADLGPLRAMCDETEVVLASSGPADQRLGKLCIDFHLDLQRITGNRQLEALMPPLLEPPFVREAFHHHNHADLSRAFAQHREMLEAIELGDGEWAEGIMLAHLRAGRHSLRRMEWRAGDAARSAVRGDETSGGHSDPSDTSKAAG